MITLSILTLERLSITFTADGKRQGSQPAVFRRRPKPGVNSLKAGIHKKAAFELLSKILITC